MVTDGAGAEQRVRDSLKATEAASLAKSEFLLRMGHELRTPLNSVLGFVQLLQMGDLTAEQAECVDRIFVACRHLLDLTNEVLDLATIESGHLELGMSDVPLLEVTSQAVAADPPPGRAHGGLVAGRHGPRS